MEFPLPTTWLIKCNTFLSYISFLTMHKFSCLQHGSHRWRGRPERECWIIYGNYCCHEFSSSPPLFSTQKPYFYIHELRSLSLIHHFAFALYSSPSDISQAKASLSLPTLYRLIKEIRVGSCTQSLCNGLWMRDITCVMWNYSESDDSSFGWTSESNCII